jgi:regulator of protease activity HflC (stomatin/prohibitin superfamily)
MDPSILIGCLTLAALVVAVGIVVSAIRIVPQYQRVVVFRFGNCIGQKGPGIVLLFPFGIDRAVTADLREEVREVPQQTNITKDNASIGIDRSTGSGGCRRAF